MIKRTKHLTASTFLWAGNYSGCIHTRKDLWFALFGPDQNAMLLFWFGAVPFHSSRSCQQTHMCAKRSGVGESVKEIKRGESAFRVDNHRYPAGCARHAGSDSFHAVAGRSNSFSLILVLNVLNECVIWAAVAQVVEQVGWKPQGSSFDSRLLLAECRGVPERGTLP